MPHTPYPTLVIFGVFLAGPGPARARLSDSVRPKTPQIPHNVAIDVYGGQQGGMAASDFRAHRLRLRPRPLPHSVSLCESHTGTVW